MKCGRRQFVSMHSAGYTSPCSGAGRLSIRALAMPRLRGPKNRPILCLPADRLMRSTAMHENTMLYRRNVLQIAAAFGAISIFSPLRCALAQARQRTPQQILGPFYPVRKMADPRGHLTHFPGKSGRADGQVIHVIGRVLDINGESVRQAKIETWQANT